MTQTIEPEVCQPSCAKSAHRDTKTIRIGLLGCGQVGAAFARLCAAPPARLTRCGIRLDVVQALVRDSKRPRASAPDVINFTDDAHAFLAGSYDVVVEALGGVAAPRSLVVRLLRAGVPVVSANKALIAACGPELRRLAWENHAEIRYEAAAIPGVSFLDAIAAPCFASAQREIIGILNGTCQFILTTLEAEPSEVDTVLRQAIRRGYCEPDPDFDVEGLDAAHKLVVILQRLGMTGLSPDRVERIGLRRVTPDLISAAARLGGCIRQIALAKLAPDAIQTYAGPALVDRNSTLATLGPRNNGVVFRDDNGNTTAFTGVGAGPEVTARSLIDDVIRIVSGGSQPDVGAVLRERPVARVDDLRTRWFLAAPLPTGFARTDRLSELLGAHGIQLVRTAILETPTGVRCLAAITNDCERAGIDAAGAELRATFGFEVTALPLVGGDVDGE